MGGLGAGMTRWGAVLGWAVCAGRAESAEVNLARGKPYTLTPAPSYRPCTDPGDQTQLTDGIKRESNWRQLSTVGWRDPAFPPTVLIDLGEIEPISEVRISSVGGGHSGVFYPTQILVMVSDDGERFRIAAARDRPKTERGGLDSFRRLPHVFRLTGLHTRGRYVQVTLAANQRFVFADEIEVIRGRHSPAEVRFGERSLWAKTEVPRALAGLRAVTRMEDGLARLTRAMDEVRTDAALGQQAEELRVKLTQRPEYSPASVEQTAAQVRALRGEWLAQRHRKALIWYQADPMAQVHPDDVLDLPSEAGQEISVELWQGEYESAVVNLVNCSPDEVILRAAVSPLRSSSGRMLAGGETLTLRRAVFVETPNAGVIGDALVRLVEGGIPLASGSAGQLWLTVHNPALAPGEYRFAIRLDFADAGDDGSDVVTVPGHLKIHPCTFPSRATLKTFNWGYLNRFGLSEEALAEVVADLEAHYTNVYVIPGSECPKASVRPDGTMAVDYSRLDRALHLFPDAEVYLLFWGYTPGRLNRHGQFGRWMSPLWKAGMSEYLKRWVAHLRAAGVGYERFAMYPFDESLSDEFYELAVFIKEVDPRIQVFANSPGRKNSRQVERCAPYVDIWCFPERKAESHRARAKVREKGHAEVWRYNATTDAKSLSPYGYYRLQPWRAWAAGDTGCAFWVYAAGKHRSSCSGWNDFTCGRGRWSVVYDGEGAPVDSQGEVFIPSRRWEAWREGIEDYEYLHTLSGRIEAARRRDVASPVVEQAEATLSRTVAEVLATGDDPRVGYAARRRITDAIIRLDEIMETAEENR